jgi:hypothetical protein
MYTRWFRNLDADPSDPDYEWPACIIIDAESGGSAKEWGDHLSTGKCRREASYKFISSDSIELTDPFYSDADWRMTPRIRQGQGATDAQLGW